MQQGIPFTRARTGARRSCSSVGQWSLLGSDPPVYVWRMPTLSFRIDDPARVAARAAAQGLSVSAYLRELVQRDLKRLPPRKQPRVDDLIGSLALGHGSDNASIRRTLTRQARRS